MKELFIEVPKSITSKFEISLNDKGIKSVSAKEEQFFGEGDLALAIVKVFPDYITAIASVIAAYAATRKIVLNIDGVTFQAEGKSTNEISEFIDGPKMK